MQARKRRDGYEGIQGAGLCPVFEKSLKNPLTSIIRSDNVCSEGVSTLID
jgi:hypothetical protein